MTFLHPLALVGLVAAAIPALLHLLERQLPPEAEFPPVRYLTEAERRSARRLRLRHLLLLILRTALIAVVVLAAAGPLVPAGAGPAAVHAPTALAVILDNSPSSSVVVDGRPVLAHLKTVARDALVRAKAADRVWLVLADGVARAGTPEALLATLDSAGVAPERLDLTAAVRQAARLVDAEPLAAREVHVVSDLQRSALGPGRAAAPRGVRVLALAPAPRAALNRGIGAVRVSDGALTIDVVGTPGAGAAPISVRVLGREVGHALAAPGASVSISLPPLAPGWWVGEATLPPDELRLDDRRLFVWHVAPPAAVTLDEGAGPFLAAAVAVLGEGRRIAHGSEVRIGDRPATARASIVLPPADAALLGQVNRALAARGVRWRFGRPGTPGPLVTGALPGSGILVARRYQLEGGRGPSPDPRGDDASVLATVNDEPWLVRDAGVVVLGSRLDTAWTALPATPAFVPFLDVLLNRVARGEAPVVAAEGLARVEFHSRGADTVAATVYGIDPRESDLTPAPPELARRLLDATLLDEPSFAAAAFAATHQTDASAPLLVLALLLAVVELAVATLTR